AAAQLAPQARPREGPLLRRGDAALDRPPVRDVRAAPRRQLRRAARRAERLHGNAVACAAVGDRPALSARSALQGDRAAARGRLRRGEEAPAGRSRGAAALSAHQGAVAAAGERMNGDDGLEPREPWEQWSDLDDTLLDGDEPQAAALLAGAV